MANEIDPGLRIDAVELAVGDLQRSADFYERVLGLSRRGATERGIALGPPGDATIPPLVLTPLARPAQLPRRASGLFHVAWLHPSRAALAASVKRVLESGWRLTGASDHH